MKITVAPDSLKESLTSPEAAEAIARGLRRADASVQVVLVPMADGGEGTVEAMVDATGGSLQWAEVCDPLGRPIRAAWGLLGDGATAVVEMAKASGLELLSADERDPMLTSTKGTGQLIRAALDRGVEHIIVGVGGSATVDGGTGMAAELGVRFLDGGGRPIPDPRGGRLLDVRDVEVEGLDPRLDGVRVTVACDVTNPLVGPDGAARTYGPQKGATPEQAEQLERGLGGLADLIRRRLDVEVADLPGAGAAGGSDLVLTAEGRVDWQSAFGKTIAGVASVASQQGIPTVALAGSLGPDYERVYECGVRAVVPIVGGPTTLEAAIAGADALLERAAELVLRMWIAARGCDGG
jgi:glycerate kinase